MIHFRAHPHHASSLFCTPRISDFVTLWDQMRVIPRPCHGKDMVIAGGPPCQGVSGLNRKALKVDIFK